MKFIFPILFLVLSCTASQAQDQPVTTVTKFIKPGTPAKKGMFNIYIQDEKYYMEIPDPLFGRDILTTITINKGSAQEDRNPQKRFGFSGDAVYDGVYRFERGSKGKIYLKQPMFYNAVDSSNSYYNLLKTRLLPVYMSFNIVAEQPGSVLLDITETFNGDFPMFSLAGAKTELELGAYQSNLSHPLDVQCYKDNIVFRSVKAYGPGVSAAPPQSMFSPGAPPRNPEPPKTLGPTVWEVGASWCLLPEVPMQQRLFDKRVGYFKKSIKDYSSDPDKIQDLAIATRWRMEPKPEDLERYQRGELVEPVKPIVFYIDKNTPEYLKPYFIAGVNVWQKSFEKIGFKNAIYARMEPTAAEDPEYAMDDVRYSIISYKPSLTPNAYGPSVVDPRSGEILNSHVAVYHNIFDLLQRWYFVMCAAADPRARQLPLAPELMGPLAQTVITHEVGHTLGLRHNFAGSSTYEIDSIRNTSFITKNGYGASIMDYMRFNYLAQPEDKIPADQLLPRIGVYDDYVIEWGYKYLPQFHKATEEADSLRLWVSEKRKDPRFFWLEEGDFTDPRVQSEDLGDNAMQAGRLGIKNLMLTMMNLQNWVGQDDENYTMLRKMHTAVAGRYNEYLGHVLKNIGGRFADLSLRAEDKVNYKPVSRATQKEAMEFMGKYFFQEPTWMFPEKITSKTRFFFDGQVEEDYITMAGKIFYKFSIIAYHQHIDGADAYTVKEFFDDLHGYIFGDLHENKPISPYRRMIQRGYINNLLPSATNPASYVDDIAIILKMQLEQIAEETEQAAKKNKDLRSQQHLKAISSMIHQWMDEHNAAKGSKNNNQ